MSFVRVHIFISGRVQGVFFRAGAQRKAEKFEVSGFARNLEDGRVEIIAEGEKENVLKLINWAKKGSLFAKVERSEVKWEEYKGEFENFEIEY